jgi:hypothetical protein
MMKKIKSKDGLFLVFEEDKPFKNAVSEKKKNGTRIANSGAGQSISSGSTAYASWVNRLFNQCAAYPRGKFFEKLR